MSFRIWGPIILIVLGVLFWLGKFDIIDFYWSRDWPVILIAIGVFSLVNLIVRKSRRKSSRYKRDILKDLEKGDIDAKEAIRRIKRL
jgi:pilus assembly protein TadC